MREGLGRYRLQNIKNLTNIVRKTILYIVIMKVKRHFQEYLSDGKGVIIRMYEPRSEEEKLFLEQYDPGEYEKPSVTADIVVFTLDAKNSLSVLLIKRGGYPYKDCWAIPGGFVEISESVDEAAARELKEETDLDGLPITQIGTFGAVDRDPRMRVISVAYMAFVPKDRLHIKAGDDARDAQMFEISSDADGLVLIGERNVVKETGLAFDHAHILHTALERLRNRIDYTQDAFRFLKNDQSFTIYELKKIYEAVKGDNEDAGNFRRDFLKKYVASGIVEETGEKSRGTGSRAATLYYIKNPGVCGKPMQ